MIVCPNTSPLLVLARVGRLDLLGDPADIVLTRAVLDEIHDKQDEATARIDALAGSLAPPVDPASSDRVDPLLQPRSRRAERGRLPPACTSTMPCCPWRWPASVNRGRETSAGLNACADAKPAQQTVNKWESHPSGRFPKKGPPQG